MQESDSLKFSFTSGFPAVLFQFLSVFQYKVRKRQAIVNKTCIAYLLNFRRHSFFKSENLKDPVVLSVLHNILGNKSALLHGPLAGRFIY